MLFYLNDKKHPTYLFTNTTKNIVVFKQILVVRPVGNRSQELDGIGDEEIILGLQADRQQEVPYLKRR